jgi:hypothetical protein
MMNIISGICRTMKNNYQNVAFIRKNQIHSRNFCVNFTKTPGAIYHGIFPPENVLRKYVFYFFLCIDVLIDIEKY